jgi:type VI secretion system protein ImpH
MAPADGRDGTSLIGLLAREPYRFDVRQAVRLLELAAHRHTAPAGTTSPPRVPVGQGSDPRLEAVRFRSSLASRFPPSEIESLTPDRQDGRPTMTVTFLGIGGAFGPLPPPLSSRVIEREHVRDHAGRDFLDVFNHRLLSLLLRQSRQFHPALQMPPATDAPARTPLLAMIGAATLPRDGSSASVEGRLGSLATTLLGSAGLLNRRPVSAHALERVLAAHFGLPMRVVSLCGGWLRIASDQVSKLGRAGRLGRDAVLGRRVWDQAAGIRIEVGPASLDKLLSLLPGRPANAELAGLTDFALADAFDVDLLLLVRAEEVPATTLGTGGSRLGWTSWLGRQPRRTPGSVRLRLGTRDAAHA